MSRIRSVHPGVWTDERFVSVSPLARLLFMGIWNECDDQGSFEWSPLKLKMRLLPADNADAAALMAELEEAGCILGYEIEGRKYGAVRNFCQYQRPKKPNSTYPQTDAVRKWVNTEARSTRDGSEGVGNQLPTDGEKPRQRKEEGGSSSSVAKATAQNSLLPADPAGTAADADAAFWATAKAYLAKAGVKNPGGVVGAWIRDHGKPETAEALTRAQLERAVEPIPFVQGCFRQGRKTAEPAGPLC